jgi:hypothetical protein
MFPISVNSSVLVTWCRFSVEFQKISSNLPQLDGQKIFSMQNYRIERKEEKGKKGEKEGMLCPSLHRCYSTTVWCAAVCCTYCSADVLQK